MNEKNYSFIFIFLSLGISWVLTFVFYSQKMLEQGIPLIMLVPGLTAVVLILLEKKKFSSIFHYSKTKGIINFIFAILFAIIVPYIIVVACAFLAMYIFDHELSSIVLNSITNFKVLYFIFSSAVFSLNIIFALGEEYGWRFYLLPSLSEKYGKLRATTIVGLVWALYHFPVMILLNLSSFGWQTALFYAVIQAMAAFVFSYIFAYAYFISNRVFPTVVMHAFWNAFNPFILGSIYTQTKGLFNIGGPIYLTNGEGVFGIIFGGLVALLCAYLIGIKRHNID